MTKVYFLKLTVFFHILDCNVIIVLFFVILALKVYNFIRKNQLNATKVELKLI